MRTMKMILATAAVCLLASNAWAADLTHQSVQQGPQAAARQGKSKKIQAATHGGKLIKAREAAEGKAGRLSILIGLSSTQESALLLSAHNNGGRDDLEIYRYVFGSSKAGEVQTSHIRKARAGVQTALLGELTSELNQGFRYQDGRFAPSDFVKVTRTKNQAGKTVAALQFVQTTQRGNKKTQRVGYAYPSKSAEGHWATKIVDYNPNTGRRESRFNASKRLIKPFTRDAGRRAPARAQAAL